MDLGIFRFFANVLGYKLKFEKCYGGAIHIYLYYRLIPKLPMGLAVGGLVTDFSLFIL